MNLKKVTLIDVVDCYEFRLCPVPRVFLNLIVFCGVS